MLPSPSSHIINSQLLISSGLILRGGGDKVTNAHSYGRLCGLWQEVEIDIELAPSDQTAIPKSKEQAERDAGNQLHMLTNRHDKFLDSLREVKVRL